MDSKQQFDQIKSRFLELRAQRELLKEQLKGEIQKKKELESRYDNILKARSIIQEVAQRTQSKLEFHISSLVSTALAAVFPQPYEFQVEFVSKRNKTECEFWFVKDGEKMKPVDSSGGGALDVASFALRLVFWTMKRTRPVMMLDEVFRFVSVDLQSKCSEMLKMLSEKLGIQIILVSHLPEIIQAADRVFHVKQVGGVSYVSQEEDNS